ncbi:mitochondrial import inner membrane translocase subunit TIM14-1 [Cinnamomum micranthum f. kanehirae]|uniref:Mitochondrial import inner membrane translocase subunit TIM14-1 n=1 Tax=Cinnamomum micranthum f. kanehirae TaxID=337451 RepID=A0A443NTC6_9MAGN|nr:mitochondrial import inner membrane translocase subunit TIM14-1 [Cinnamomum micranthum f. kanehirae]
MATPFLAGLVVGAVAFAGRYGVQAWQAFKTRPVAPRFRKFYEGGFQPMMTRREAALILGIRENVAADKVKEAHRKVMVATTRMQVAATTLLPRSMRLKM